MKRIIKFRGRRLDGPLIYGDLVHTDGKPYIKIAEGGQWKVKPDSIAQLIAVDINGNEVYEGDFCTCKGSIAQPFQATFDHFTHIRDGKIVLEVTQ